MKIEIEIAPRRIADLMITAFEGGANYWCSGARLGTANGRPKAAFEKPWYSDPKVWECASVEFFVTEITDETTGAEKTHRLTRLDIETGLKLMAEKWGRHFGDFVSENEDAETADVFLQCVVLKDIVYG